MLRCFVFLLLLPFSAQALELNMPIGLVQSSHNEQGLASLALPTGVWNGTEVPSITLTGQVATTTFHSSETRKPGVVAAEIWPQLEARGYDLALHCSDQTCGGYDFRFAAEVLPAPNMYVNIRSYHALTALRGEEGGGIQAVSVMASAASGASFVQIIQAGTDAVETTVQTTARTPLPSGVPVAGPIPEALAGNGHVVLSQLDFESGRSQLGQGPFSVLEELARALQAQPEMRIALVGHTDNIGGLDGNIALSVSRAQAVRERLITQYAISPDRLEARGMGYLSPHTTNTTEAGREANRRVEAVVLAQ